MTTSKKISALDALGSATTGDLLPIVDDPSGTAQTKKITVDNLFGNVQVASVFKSSLTSTGSYTANTINATGAVAFSNTLTVNGAVTFNSSVNVSGNATFNTSVTFAKATTFSNTLTVSGPITFTNNIVSSFAVSNTSAFLGSAVFSNTVSIIGAALVSNTTIFVGNSTFSNTIAAAGLITGAAGATITGTANVSTMINVGANVSVNTSGISVGNSIANAIVSSTNFALNGNVAIYAGSATTRTAVRSQVGTGGENGSVYLSTAGKMYLKVNIAGADTDWQKVTTTAAD